MQSREHYFSSGGKSFNYIAALNDDDDNILSLETIILNEVSGWDNIKINSKDNLSKTTDLFENIIIIEKNEIPFNYNFSTYY